MEVNGVVFDLDATLVNMGGFVRWRDAHKEVKACYLSTECSEEMVERCSGRGLFNMLNLVRDEISETLPDTDVERIQSGAYEVLESFESESVERCELMLGCPDALEWLRERGIKMGVATSNSERIAEEILRKRELRHFFSAVVGRRPELKMKPYPDQLLKCFEEMKVDPSEGVMVGDSVRDVVAAKAADIFVIAVPSPFTKRDVLVDAGVDIIIESLTELPAKIRELTA